MANLSTLKTEIEALQSSSIQNGIRRSRDRLNVGTALKSATMTVDKFDIGTFVAHVQARNDASRRNDESGSKAFDGASIPGLLNQEWCQFIQAGEEYLQKHSESSYPALHDPCAYCRQPLDAAALELIRKYRDFTNNEIRAILEAAERQLQEYARPVLELKVDELALQLTEEAIDENDTLRQTVQVVDQIRRLTAAVAAPSIFDWQDKAAALASAEAILSGEETRLTLQITDLQQSAEQRQTALRVKQTELTELEAIKKTNALLPQIERRVSDAKWIARATTVKSNLPGILRTLTEAAKSASEELLDKDFGRRFEEECKLLRAPNVTLNFPGRQGQVTRRKLVSSYNPSAVLSEGELKALALADFLAEATSVPASTPVVFDDPITSMDHRRIHEVCDRIVELSTDHQIIVFTHNIWFAAELLSKADKKTWKYYDIRKDNGTAGVVTQAPHPRVDTIAQVSQRVNNMIEATEKQTDGVVRAALVEKGYEELRGLCEIVVEHEMFKGVVQRYAPNVMFTKLDKINVDKLQEAMAAITPVFEKACRYIASHSQPIETQGIRPSLDELKADFKTISDARLPHKEKLSISKRRLTNWGAAEWQRPSL